MAPVVRSRVLKEAPPLLNKPADVHIIGDPGLWPGIFLCPNFAFVNYLSIGKIAGSFGVQGEVVLQHALGKKTVLQDLEALFVEMRKGEFLPYFIVSARAKSDTEIYIKLEGVDSREAALKLNQRPVWLEESDFKRFASASASISLLGFSVIHGSENLGEIREVIEQPHQMLCRIDLNGKEALLPVNESTLVKVDQPARLVYLDLPDGLLDLYA